MNLWYSNNNNNNKREFIQERTKIQIAHHHGHWRKAMTTYGVFMIKRIII